MLYNIVTAVCNSIFYGGDATDVGLWWKRLVQVSF
jgi:hypothetical protein